MSFRERFHSKKESLMVWVAVFIILAFVTLLCPPYYSMNDDGMMKSILSGAYTGTPDGHAVYMKYPLTGIISLFYRFTGQISWFDVVLLGCFWVSLSSVISTVVRLCKEQFSSRGRALSWILGIAGLCLGLFLPHLLTLHYTLVAAMTGSCGLFLLLTGSGFGWVVLLILCYCIRSQVFFLLLPFCGVVLLWRLMSQKREGLLKQFLALAVGIGVCMLWNHLMYASPEWQDYAKYNEARTALYDYEGLLPYEEYEALFEAEGISRQQHRIMEEYVLVLDQTVTAQVQQKAADLSTKVQGGQRGAVEYLVQCIKEYYYHIMYTDQPYNWLMIGGYLLVFVLLLIQKCPGRLLLLGCMAGGRSLIWIYLIWRGRFPERIYVSLYFIDLMILAAMAVDMIKTWKTKYVSLIGMLICVLFLSAGGMQFGEMYQRTKQQSLKQQEWEALVQYCEKRPDTVFLLDVRSMVSYTGKVGALSKAQENHLLSGGWMSHSPLLSQRLQGSKDGGELLAVWEQECCYVIAAKRDVGWLKEYCKLRFEGLELEKKDTVCVDGAEIFYVYGRSKD